MNKYNAVPTGLSVPEYIEDLIACGYTKSLAIQMAKEEIEKRRKSKVEGSTDLYSKHVRKP
jgi:hypothetical protein